MNVFVIIVTYNGSKWVDKCFGSLRRSTVPLQTIVVDNNSTDDTGELIREKFPEVTFVQSDINLGFGAGNNLGIKMALEKGADYLFLLNQDAWIQEKTIEKLIDAAETNNDFGVLSPVHFNGNGDLLDKNFSSYLAADHRKLLTDLVKKDLKPLYEIKFVNAAAWLINARCIKEVGLFDPVFFHYGEDENFIDRCRYFGYKTGLVIDSRIWHDREEVTAEKEAEIQFDLKLMKTSWIVKMTDINNKNWESEYNKKLVKFVSRTFYRSSSYRKNLLHLFFQLKKMKKDIKMVRKRMLKGYNGYKD